MSTYDLSNPQFLDLAIKIAGDRPIMRALREVLIIQAVERCRGNRSRAAKLLGVARSTFNVWCQEIMPGA